MQVLYNCEHIFAEIAYINSPLWLALEGLYTREYSNSKRGPSLSLCLQEKNSVALKSQTLSHREYKNTSMALTT